MISCYDWNQDLTVITTLQQNCLKATITHCFKKALLETTAFRHDATTVGFMTVCWTALHIVSDSVGILATAGYCWMLVHRRVGERHCVGMSRGHSVETARHQCVVAACAGDTDDVLTRVTKPGATSCYGYLPDDYDKWITDTQSHRTIVVCNDLFKTL